MNKCLSILFMNVALLMACSTSSDKTLEEMVVAKCQSQRNCIIIVRELTNFKWDKMFIFNEGATLSEIRKALGLDFPDFNEFSRKIVFLSRNKIIYREEKEYNPSERAGNSVWFHFPEPTVHQMEFTPMDAIFKVEREVIDGKVYYTLFEQ